MIKYGTEKPSEFSQARIDEGKAGIERHVIRFGPDWADIIVIEGRSTDLDVTRDWKDKRGVQSSEVFNAWARQE